MKAEVVNAFIQASVDVIAQTTGINVKVGKAFRKDVPYKSDSLVVLIGLTGSLQGTVTISTGSDLARSIASRMMGGMPVPELDEMAKSAVAELCNMILGNACMLLSQEGISVDVTPPTTLTGENMKFSIQNSIIICVPLLFSPSESMELNISYQEK